MVIYSDSAGPLSNEVLHGYHWPVWPTGQNARGHRVMIEHPMLKCSPINYILQKNRIITFQYHGSIA